MKRTFLAVTALLALSQPVFAQTRALPAPEIKANGDITFGNALKLGRRDGARTVLTPDELRIPAPDTSAPAAAIKGDGNISARGLNAISDGSNSNPIGAFWAQIGNDNLIRYANQARLTSKLDGEAWESALGADCQFKTGFNRVYTSGMTVAVGDNIVGATGVPEAYTYRVLQAGTLGTSSPTAGPGSAPFNSGTARLQWINYTNLSAKLCFTSTTFVEDGGGNSWGANFNFQLRPMSKQPRFQTGIEQDFVNRSGYDCDLFSGNTCNPYNLFVDGSNRSTVGFNLGTHSTGPKHVLEWGLAIQGQWLARDAALEINTNSRFGIGIGRHWNVFGRSVYENAAYLDETQSPRAISLGGVYSNAALSTADATITPQGGFPTAFSMSDNQQVCWQNINACMRYDSASSALAYRKNGADIFSVTDAGVLGAPSLKVSPNPTYQFTITYDTAGDQTVLQSNHNGLYSTTLSLNPNNGVVRIGPGGLNANGTAGATCTAPPTSGFRVIGGIVTAC